MRFFKYFILFFLFTSTTQAAWKTKSYAEPNKSFPPDVIYNTHTEVCQVFGQKIGAYTDCFIYEAYTPDRIYLKRNGTPVHVADYVAKTCPAKNTMAIFWYPAATTQIHTRRCHDGCSYTGSGQTTSYPNYEMTTMFATGDDLNCVDQFNNKTETECNKSDPYGGCYQPPNDDCVRLSDGSITCPTSTPPPVNPTCGGATYCERPPEGCGEGYVSGSFNGQQLCVKTSTSTPTEPTEPTVPNECTAAYCEKTDNNEDCPSGYYPSSLNGTAICVANNPTPNDPNPNDPNNSDSGSGSSEPQNGDDPTTNFDVKGIIDAIKALRDSLLSAIDKVSKKITSLVEGQKITNEHLKNIQDETIKTNEKLDTANGHLTKIEENTKSSSESLTSIKDSTLATSEAVGETNQKLDKINDSVQSQTNCVNQNYNPNEPSSTKYRQCTPEELQSLGETNASIPKREIGQQSFSLNLFQVNASNCPQDRTLSIPTPFGTFTKTVSVQDMCNETAWFGYIVLIIAYSFAVGIVLRA